MPRTNGRSAICARDTRLAASVLDRERTVNLSISSSVIVNSITRRHPGMIRLLVLPNRKTRNPPANHPFHGAGFMESIV